MNQTPLNDRVIVRRLEEEAPSKIIIEGSKDKSMKAEVIAAGPGKLTDQFSVIGQHVVPYRIPMSVKPGDVVLIGKYSGVEYQEMDRIPDGEFKGRLRTTTYVIIREEDILSIFKEEKK